MSYNYDKILTVIDCWAGQMGKNLALVLGLYIMTTSQIYIGSVNVYVILNQFTYRYKGTHPSEEL